MNNISNHQPPNIDADSFVSIRKYLHQIAELSNQEFLTADYIAKQLSILKPSEIIHQAAGTGVIAIFDSNKQGKTLLFRCELDALPIQETNQTNYLSHTPNVAHLCGHDGHMTILLRLAKKITENPPKRGKVILLFQPAEETGEGANRIIQSNVFKAHAIDYCYALHNLPKYPMGEIIVKDQTFNCASIGVIINLKGITSHAAHPEAGISPELALLNLLTQFKSITSKHHPSLAMITVTHCAMGEETFGISPDCATIMATLRTDSNSVMEKLKQQVIDTANNAANQQKLQLTIDWSDEFKASVNHTQCVNHIINAAEQLNYPVTIKNKPFRWSEDFGAISQQYAGAMFALGAGENCHQLHHPNYLFPDTLITKGSDLFYQLYINHLG